MRKYIFNNIIPPILIITLISLSFNRYIKPTNTWLTEHEKPYINHNYDSIISAIDYDMKNGFLKGQYPGAAIVIVKDNHILFMKSYGVKEYGTNDSVDINTVFRLGSVSKGFAGALSGIMVQEKIFDWDDTVKHFLPSFNLQNDEYENEMTIRHLLSHTTGLPVHAYTVLLDDNVPYEKIKPLLCSIPSIGPPGKYYSYQNVIYSMVADIMEVQTGKNYPTLLKKKLFQPLKMYNASADYESIIKNKDVAKPHVKLKNGKWLPEKQNKRYYSVAPAAGVNASISDMSKYLVALLGYVPEVLDTSILDDIFEPNIQSNIKWKYKKSWKKLNKVYYGLGWRIFDYNNNKIVFHSGYVRGYKAEIALMPSDGIGIAVLFNGASYYSSHCIPNFIDNYLALKNNKNLNLN